MLWQDEPLWHNADSDKHESEGEGERYEFGQECLDRISLALGGNTIVPLASTMLPALMQDSDWKKRHAALICLSQIAEGCVKVLTKNISGLADLCLLVRASPLGLHTLLKAAASDNPGNCHAVIYLLHHRK